MTDDYVEDRLAGRRIFWCPSGEGYLAYCPQPTDADEYVYCCTYYYLGEDMPSCCRFPIHAGILVAGIISAIIATLLLGFFACWCYMPCPLARRIATMRRVKRSWPTTRADRIARRWR